MKAVLGPAKFLQSSKDLYEWIEQKLNTIKPKEELDMDRIRAEGFGPEAHEQEPQEKTKMITWNVYFVVFVYGGWSVSSRSWCHDGPNYE